MIIIIINKIQVRAQDDGRECGALPLCLFWRARRAQSATSAATPPARGPPASSTSTQLAARVVTVAPHC